MWRAYSHYSPLSGVVWQLVITACKYHLYFRFCSRYTQLGIVISYSRQNNETWKKDCWCSQLKPKSLGSLLSVTGGPNRGSGPRFETSEFDILAKTTSDARENLAAAIPGILPIQDWWQKDPPSKREDRYPISGSMSCMRFKPYGTFRHLQEIPGIS